MSERLRIIKHEDIDTLFIDISSLSVNDILEIHKKILDIAVSKKIGFFIIDISNTFTTPVVIDSSKELDKVINEKNGKSYTALLGISGLQKLIANVISRDMYFARDIEDAKRWLFVQLKKIR